MKNNKIIMGFLGQTEEPYYLPQFGYILSNGDWKDTFIENELKFHKSFDWLMCVVEKIEDIECSETSTEMVGYHLFDVEIRQNVCTIHGADIEESSSDKIDNVYNAVVEFIIWYNENKI